MPPITVVCQLSLNAIKAPAPLCSSKVGSANALGTLNGGAPSSGPMARIMTVFGWVPWTIKPPIITLSVVWTKLCHGLQPPKSNAAVTSNSASGTNTAQRWYTESALRHSASPLRVRPTANGNLALGPADGIAYVANRVNQRRFTKFFSEPTNEHLNELGIVFMRVLPHAFAQFRACEHAARFPHQHL